MPSLSFDHAEQSNPLRTPMILQHAPCGSLAAAFEAWWEYSSSGEVPGVSHFNLKEMLQEALHVKQSW